MRGGDAACPSRHAVDNPPFRYGQDGMKEKANMRAQQQRINRLSRSILLLMLLAAFPASSGELSLIPQPVRLETLPGNFVLSPTTTLQVDPAFASEGALLRRRLQTATGFPLSEPGPANSGGGVIRLLKTSGTIAGSEAYSIVVSPKQATLRASEPAGIFRATQTLLQLLPDWIMSTTRVAAVSPAPPSKVKPGPARLPPEPVACNIPCVKIEDTPRFAWRGLMLDCSRTFQSLDYLKQTLDRMACYKLNVLHLHLTDDQGWRLEIKKYPELTRKGAQFPARYNEPPSHQGFYTQEQMREVVAYAAARHITIVPEIEMPGHSLAALACYPRLSCTGGPFDIFPFFKGPDITANVFCAGNDASFEFLDGVLAEVAAIFPNQYIHIGGDEVPKTAWKVCPKCQARIKAEGLKDEGELQSYFTRRVEKLVEKHGKRLVGWDEIIEGGLAPNATVMSWRGMEGGMAAAKAGHDVVMSPTSHCYFDYPYSGIDSARVFAFDPVAGIPPEAARHVLGLQANFWSHIDREPELVDRQLFPRLLALAERGWSADNRSEWTGYQRRARAQLPRLKQLGIRYQPFDLAVPVGEWSPQSFAGGATNLEFDVTEQIAGPGNYVVKPLCARGAHGVSVHGADLLGGVVASDRHEGFAGNHPTNDTFVLLVPPIAYSSRSVYRLRLILEPAGGTDTWGKVYFTRSASN